VGSTESVNSRRASVATEFSSFDGSSRRPDVIAIDKTGALTVVELKLDAADWLVLVPRTIIPLPETRDFMVSVERKEASENQADNAAQRYLPLWTAVTRGSTP
jgi:hypothetical protein